MSTLTPELAAVPPQNLDAEESVLGALLLSENALATASGEVSAADFYRESNGRIFQAALDLAARSEPVDAITLANFLDERGELEGIGGRVRIYELAALVPATANVGHYARIVREMARLRGLIRVGLEISQLGYERPGPSEELVDQAEALVGELSEERQGETLFLGADLAARSFERVQQLYEKGGGLVGTPSGFPSLDQLTAGFQPGNLIICAARPSIGKTSFALSIASHLAFEQQLPVAVFTLEMTADEVGQRLQSLVSGIDLQRLRSGQLRAEEWPKLAAACDRIAAAPIAVDEAPAPTSWRIRARLRQLKRRWPQLALVVIDYIQLADPGQRTDSREREIALISRSLKLLARDLQLPVLALSQLSRKVEEREEKRPQLSDLRDSGSLEQDADLVLFLYREEYYRRQSQKKGEAEAILAKQRNGPTGTVKLAFHARQARFAELA